MASWPTDLTITGRVVNTIDRQARTGIGFFSNPRCMTTAVSNYANGIGFCHREGRFTWATRIHYDLRHSHRRNQQGPSEVRIAAKAEQLNQNNDPEGREVVQAFNPRLITGDRSRQSTTSHWCMESEMTDLRLLTPFSCETRHSVFLQDLINTFPHQQCARTARHCQGR